MGKAEPIGRMRAVQDPYFDAFDAIAGLVRARVVPEGYERIYRRGSLFVVVCPWHWRAYSHYQFWELLAAAHLARLSRARSVVLATNAEWTDWCWQGFEACFDQLLVGAPRPVAAEAERLLEEDPVRGIRAAVPAEGRLFFGSPKPDATTATLKASLASGLLASGESVDRRARVVPYFGGPRHVTFHHHLSNGLLVDAKGFRNPDPIHELKILAGKAFAIGGQSARTLLYVVDGRVSAAEAGLVTRAGASVTTPDQFRDAFRALAPNTSNTATPGYR